MSIVDNSICVDCRNYRTTRVKCFDWGDDYDEIRVCGWTYVRMEQYVMECDNFKKKGKSK